MQFYDFPRQMNDVGQLFDPNEVMRTKINRMRMNELAADEQVQKFQSAASLNALYAPPQGMAPPPSPGMAPPQGITPPPSPGMIPPAQLPRPPQVPTQQPSYLQGMRVIRPEQFEAEREKLRSGVDSGDPVAIRTMNKVNQMEMAQAQEIRKAEDAYWGGVSKNMQGMITEVLKNGHAEYANRISDEMKNNPQFMDWLRRNDPARAQILEGGVKYYKTTDGKTEVGIREMEVTPALVRTFIQEYPESAKMFEGVTFDDQGRSFVKIRMTYPADGSKPEIVNVEQHPDKERIAEEREDRRFRHQMELQDRRLAAGVGGGAGSRSFGVQQAPGVSRDTQGRYFEWDDEGQKRYLSTQEVQDRAAQAKEEGAQARQRGGATSAKMDAAYRQYTEAIPELEALSQKIRSKQMLPSNITSMNKLNDWVASETSDPDVARFKTQLSFTADALSSAIGTGRGGRWTFDLAKELLNKNYSPEAFRRVLEGHKKELDVMRRSYREFGKTEPRKRDETRNIPPALVVKGTLKEGSPIPREVARKFLNLSGGDMEEARKLATESGWTIPQR